MLNQKFSPSLRGCGLIQILGPIYHDQEPRSVKREWSLACLVLNVLLYIILYFTIIVLLNTRIDY